MANKQKDETGHDRIFPKSVKRNIGDKKITIVPISVEDCGRWFKILDRAFEKISGKDEIGQVDFIRLIVESGCLKDALSFIVKRPRMNEQLSTFYLNEEIKEHEIANCSLNEAFEILEGLAEVTEVETILGKLTGLWRKLENLTGAGTQAEAQKSEKSSLKG